MADDLFSSLKLSAAGMKAQGTRLRVISENIANADSLPTEPGKNPYRRKHITFKNVMNRELGMPVVKVDKIRPDQGEFAGSSPIIPRRTRRATCWRPTSTVWSR